MSLLLQNDVFEVYEGDSLVILKAMTDNSVDSIVTDPPYGISFMGNAWDYQVPSAELWAECLRVLKPGGHLLAFAGTRTQHRMAVNIEDAGFEIRDMLAWLYGSGFPKSHNISKAIDKKLGAKRKVVGSKEAGCFGGTDEGHHTIGGKTSSVDVTVAGSEEAQQWEGWGTALKPALEPITMARKPFKGTVADNVLEHGVGGLNIDESRVGDFVPTQPSALTYGRHYEDREEIAVPTPTKPGRYPSNVMHDGSQPVVDLFPNKKGAAPALQPITMARKPFKGTVADNVMKHGVGGLNIDASRVPGDYETRDRDNKGGDSMFGTGAGGGAFVPTEGRWPANVLHDGSEAVVDEFPSSKASKGTTYGRGFQTAYVNGEDPGRRIASEGYADEGSAARFFYVPKASKKDRDEGLAGPERDAGCMSGNTNADTLRVEKVPQRKNIHPTVKPTTLMAYLCKLVTPPGGLVLDPFNGSGSTGKGAVGEGFRYIGIELNPEFCEISRARIGAVLSRLEAEQLTSEQPGATVETSTDQP